MINEDEQIKEVFAHYGSAVYLLQTLEKGIVTIVSFIQNTNLNGTRHDLDKLLASNFRLTLGDLIKSLKDILTIDETVTNQLNEVLKVRNWVVHHYWWDRAVEFSKIEGRYKMIKELKQYKTLFENLDSCIEEKAKMLFAKKGITEDKLNIIYNEIINRDISPITNRKRKIKSKEKVVRIYHYFIDSNKSTILLKMEDNTFWYLNEKGLDYGPFEIEGRHIKPVIKFKEVVPAEIEIKKSNMKEWDYYIKFSTGYLLKLKFNKETMKMKSLLERIKDKM